MSATLLPLRIGSHSGYLFASTLGTAVCFVPEDCVAFHADGRAEIDDLKYLVDGWARRNAACNADVPCHRLFANPRQPVDEVDSSEINAFISRHAAF